MTSARVATLGLLLVSCSVLAQTRYNNQIQPGLSTVTEVENAVGKPLRALSKTRFEYPPPSGATKLTIEYLGPKVNWIIVEFQQPYARSAIVQAMKLPEPPQKSGLLGGAWAELYGAPALIALGYVGADPSSGVKTVSYYSDFMFEMSMNVQWIATPPKAP